MMSKRSVSIAIVGIVAIVFAACDESKVPPAREQAPGPLRVSSLNPRYFSDGASKAIYVTGSHTWSNFQDRGVAPVSIFDYTAYLDLLQRYNHNFMRMWVWEQAAWAPWTADTLVFDPLPYMRTGPGRALDGGLKFDLNEFNQTYFDRLRSRVVAARDRGIYVMVMLFQGFSTESKGITRGNPWPGHPYNIANNVNGINGDPNGDGEGREVHTLGVPPITALQEAYVRKVVDTLNDLDNVLYEISNESHAGSTNWQYHMIIYIHEYQRGKSKQHPVVMTVAYPSGKNTTLFRSPAEAISPGPAGGYKENPPRADGRKIIISDTDHLWGIGGNQGWVWKSFLRGLNPIYMDPYDSSASEGVRRSMGHTLTYAKRMDLAAMLPHNDLASTGYCLANPVATSAEYLVYLPFAGTVTVDLSAASGTLDVEWFNPTTGATVPSGTTTGGASRSFTAPFTDHAVLYLAARKTTL